MTDDNDELDEVIAEFIVESHESMDELDRDLVVLEQEATPESLARIFRAIHTVKGTSGFLGFGALESITHVGENLLSKLRDGVLTVDSEITTALLAMVDAVREILSSIEADGHEGERDDAALVATLTRLESGEVAAASTAEPLDAASAPTAAEPLHVADATPADAASDVAPPAEVRSGPTPAEVDETEVDATDVAIHDATDVAIHAGTDVADAAPDLVGTPHAPPHPVADAHPDLGADPAGSTVERSAAAESIRVDVGLLDDLMNLVGELVLARNQILQHTTTELDAGFLATTQRLDTITTELQEGVMRTRMQPIENVWNKFPRVVRDLSLACGKQARLVMDGKHTELDKSLLESIKDPLTHLVRNCVDHGLEAPHDRVASGKDPEGTVRLRAYHEGGQVIIEISDDGRGIDPDAIRRAAAEKGLFGRRTDRRYDDREVLDMIFRPGFSTAATVTNISGRGVGMDVVRTNIEGIGGTVDVSSTVGAGTVFKIKIPLTLAIIPALVVTCDGDRFAIPQVNLRELVRIDGHDPHSAIEHVHGAPVHRLRGRLLPIVHLRHVFGTPPADHDAGFNIVVVHADDREFGLVVDEINDTAEIVVKPLGRILKQIPAFAGATIMGDGHVALILDVLGIADSIGLQHVDQRRDDVVAAEADDGGEAQRILMFRIGERRLGLLLSTVARLEEFAPDRLEVTCDRRVVQYRGRILDLVFLADALGIPSDRGPDETLNVIVCSDGARDVGLVVDDISDIVEERLDLDAPRSGRGVSTSSIVHGRVVDVVDVDDVVRRSLPTPTVHHSAA